MARLRCTGVGRSNPSKGTSMTKEALKLALEALETYYGYMEPLLTVFGGPRVPAEQSTTWKVEQAITAIKEALAQPEQEPQIAFNPEVVGYVAPQRTWVGLTDREFEEATHGMEDLEDIWKAIEAKLRSKNV